MLGIDAGYRNFAVCRIDNGHWYGPTHWVNAPLFDGNYSEQALFEAIYQWCHDNRALLDSVDIIVLERQIAKKFSVVNTVIRTMYHDKTREVHPSTVGAFFRLPADRPSKKKAAVALTASNTEILRLVGARKKDDLADAFLLAVWFLQSSDPLLREREGWNEYLQPGVARGRPRPAESRGGQSPPAVNRGGYDIDLVSEDSISE